MQLLTAGLGTLLTNARGAECPQLVKADAAPTQHSGPLLCTHDTRRPPELVAARALAERH